MNTNQTFSMPTFKPKCEKPPKELDITKLTKSQISSLRKDDPFMYYSIFGPNGQVSSEVMNRANSLPRDEEGKESQEGSSSALMVRRRTRVSAESDNIEICACDTPVENESNGQELIED